MTTDKPSLCLGSGQKQRPGAVNVDIVATTSPDFVHDLNCFPWPFETSQFSECRAYDVIEHLDNIVRVVDEIITVPHFSSVNAFTDPIHRHYFSAASFNYFTGDNDFGFYSSARFHKIVWRIANTFPAGV